MTTQEILEAARAAKTVVALASSETRTHALWAMSDWLCHPEKTAMILLPVPSSRVPAPS